MTYPRRATKINQTVFVRNPDILKRGIEPFTNYVVDLSYMDLGSDPIVLKGEGSYQITGEGLAVSYLGTTGASTPLFVNDSGVDASGSLFLEKINVFASGAGSGIFALDSENETGAIECVNVNFINSPSLGYLAGYRSFFVSGAAYFGLEDGLEFRDGFGGIVLNDTVLIPVTSDTPIAAGGVSTPFTGTMLKAGSGFLLSGSFRSNVNALSIDDTGTVCDFAPAQVASDAGFSGDLIRVNPNSNAFPNMPASSVKANFARTCVNVPVTHPGGKMTISTEVTTAIAASDTLYPVEGVGTYSDLTWWAAYGSGDYANELEYISDIEADYTITIAVSIGGGNNDQCGIQIQKYDSDSMTYSDIGPRYRSTINGGGGTRAENITGFADATFKNGDRVRIAIENQTDTSDMTLLIGSIIKTDIRG